MIMNLPRNLALRCISHVYRHCSQKKYLPLKEDSYTLTPLELHFPQDPGTSFAFQPLMTVWDDFFWKDEKKKTNNHEDHVQKSVNIPTPTKKMYFLSPIHSKHCMCCQRYCGDVASTFQGCEIRLLVLCILFVFFVCGYQLCCWYFNKPNAHLFHKNSQFASTLNSVSYLLRHSQWYVNIQHAWTISAKIPVRSAVPCWY